MDEVHGSGSAELMENATLENEFDFHNGDEAILIAKGPPKKNIHACYTANPFAQVITIAGIGTRTVS